MRRSLATRLVALGILQLVLIAGTAAAIFVVEGPHEPGHPEEHIVPTMVARLEAVVDRPALLDATLEYLKDQRIEITLYDADRQVVATNVDPPLALPPRRMFPPVAVDGLPMPHEHHVVVRPLFVHGGLGLLIARGVHGRPPGAVGPLLVLICGFLIVVAGALVTARWIVRPIERLSRTARALGAGDLSARSRLERSDEIGELGRRIDDMADRIERLLVTEKELLANVAHELRTPLTRIGVALDLASEGDAERARASLAEIAVDVAELETIVDDILTTMRFEIAGPGAQLPLRREPTPARTLADAAADRMRARHPERPLVVTVAGDTPELDIDRMLFRRAVDNLLQNAHKYTPDPTAPIELAIDRDGDHVAIEVRDRGIGISAKDLPRVFTAFFRGDRSRSRETGGVGLGLTLAKRIVEAHGGTIGVTSEPNTGTTVRITVPAA
jgi:signal transduction histidine kinase